MDAVEGCGAHGGDLAKNVLRNRPLVMRGCVAEASPRAMGWTNQYLTANAANQSSKFCPETLGEYLARGMPYYRNCGELPDALLADVALPEALRAVRHDLDNAVLWIGSMPPSGYSSPLHFDPNENIMHIIDGEKHLLLIDPAESVLVYADFADASSGNSPVDPKRVDLAAYPLAAHVSIWPVRLKPGDALLIPSGWWHVVTTMPNRSVALTLQFVNPIQDRGQSNFTFTQAQDKLALRHASIPPRIIKGGLLPSDGRTNSAKETSWGRVVPLSLLNLLNATFHSTIEMRRLRKKAPHEFQQQEVLGIIHADQLPLPESAQHAATASNPAASQDCGKQEL